MNEIIELENQILKFNNDPQVFALRTRYAQKTFLDIMSVARSENRHSAFLAWLLKGEDFAVSPQDHPIVHLLDSIITRVGENEIDKDKIVNSQNFKINNYDQLKEVILTRDIKSIEIEEIKTEKSLGELCVDSSEKPLQGLPKLDRIDVYIRLSIARKTKSGNLNYEIIIENKIGSSEGGKPTGKYAKPIEGEKIDVVFCEPQTVRYFRACTHENRANKPINGSIFVYLTPDLEKDPTSPYFIHITYQDVLDRVIDPLLLPDVNTSDRVRLFLEEYISSLSLPAYEQSDDSEDNTQQIKDAIIMAVRSKEKDQLSNLWKQYKGLLTSAIEAYNQTDGEVPQDSAIQTLKQFCEVNKELIIAILRVAVEANPTDSELKEAYKYLIRQKHDYSTFTINGETEVFSKGLFFLEIVKRWADAYSKGSTISNPVKTIKNLNLKGGKDDTIISQGEYGNLMKQVNAKKDPKDRYYNEENDIIVVEGENYYVSTQWGQSGKRFQNWLDFIGITFNKFDNTQNGEIGQLNIDESNADGARVLCDIGIKKITWKRILK